MINLNTYIIEKLRINDNTKLIKNNNDYLMIVAYGDAFDYLRDNYKDVMVSPILISGDPIGFILIKDDALNEFEYCKKNFNDVVELYIIPKDKIDDFASDYESGNISIEELKILKKIG